VVDGSADGKVQLGAVYLNICGYYNPSGPYYKRGQRELNFATNGPCLFWHVIYVVFSDLECTYQNRE
jgi:hypothetical protein